MTPYKTAGQLAKAQYVRNILERLRKGSPYTESSGFIGELTLQLSKLSNTALGDLLLLVRLHQGATGESDAYEEVRGYVFDKHWREPDTPTMALAAKHAARIQEQANAVLGFVISVVKDKDND